MNITRDNYESWFMDYLDGKLNTGQREKLMIFLEFNPDLEQELDGLELVSLEAGSESYQQKRKLFKPDEFETLCISSIEKQLSPEEEGHLQNLLNTDPERTKTYQLYLSTLLKADDSISYPKKSLLRKRFIDIPFVRITASAVAAAAVILMAVSIILKNPADQEVLYGQQEITVSGEENAEKESHALLQADVREEIQVSDTREVETLLSESSGTKSLDTESSGAESFQQEMLPAPVMESESMRKAGVHLSVIKSLDAELISPGERVEQRLMAYRLKEYAGTRTVVSTIPEREERKISFWKLADAGIQKINELSEEDYSLERKVDEMGHTRRFTFESPIFGISTPMGNTNQPQ